MATIGWYGPLINLSEASSHIGHFVQLLVFIHKTIPVQYKSSGGGKVIRTDIHVGDDTRRYFTVSIWQKNMESNLTAGSIVLLQNVKVTQFGDVVEAKTVQQSSIQCLVDTYESIRSEGENNSMLKACHAGIATKEKLKKVIAWVLRVEPILDMRISHSSKRNQMSVNWKLPEEVKNKDCLSLVEVSKLNDSCNAYFFASIGEMFLPITSMHLHEEMMFIRSRIFSSNYENLVEDLICTGCQLCGAPLNSESGSRIEKPVPLYCGISCNRLHVVSLIYRPFLLYLWDESTYIPVVVNNKAAEMLFGNIKAASVHSSYKKQSCGQLTTKSSNVAIEDQYGPDMLVESLEMSYLDIHYVILILINNYHIY
ncbi:uncharacterized protein [Rutidosis leptorrhynchoides]|uniref:uncharacterized protein isoform X2 n=1 Tax=Rutidosis leptorrhynchoides TaxID=125765 RepID=UPI003A99E9A8